MNNELTYKQLTLIQVGRAWEITDERVIKITSVMTSETNVFVRFAQVKQWLSYIW